MYKPPLPLSWGKVLSHSLWDMHLTIGWMSRHYFIKVSRVGDITFHSSNNIAIPFFWERCLGTLVVGWLGKILVWVCCQGWHDKAKGYTWTIPHCCVHFNFSVSSFSRELAGWLARCATHHLLSRTPLLHANSSQTKSCDNNGWKWKCAYCHHSMHWTVQFDFASMSFFCCYVLIIGCKKNAGDVSGYAYLTDAEPEWSFLLKAMETFSVLMVWITASYTTYAA